MNTHWQNLTDNRSGFWAGRAWLHTAQRTFNVEWHHGRQVKSGAVGITLFGLETLLVFHLAIPFLISWFFTVSGKFYDGERERDISLSVFDGGVWWCLWMHPDNWSSTDPKWRRGCWRPLDTFLGKQKHSQLIIRNGNCSIDMREGVYLGTYTESLDTWKRPRWPRRLTVRRFHIDMTEPIPEPGKGTTSYNLQDSDLESMTVTCETLGEALERVRNSVIEWRERYGGRNWEPS